MTDIQLLTMTITLLAILGAMYGNRKSVEDMRDVLRAEAKTQTVELRAEVKAQTVELTAVLQRIENKLDHLAETVASHSEKLGDE